MTLKSKLRKELEATFTLEELRTLCFDLEINFENLPGNTRSGKTTELVDFCERNGQMPELIRKCTVMRPRGDWPDIAEINKPSSKSESTSSFANVPPAWEKEKTGIELTCKWNNIGQWANLFTHVICEIGSDKYLIKWWKPTFIPLKPYTLHTIILKSNYIGGSTPATKDVMLQGNEIRKYTYQLPFWLSGTNGKLIRTG